MVKNVNINRICTLLNEKNFVLIDLRSNRLYREGHIRGAINIPYEELVTGRQELLRNRRYIFYCEQGTQSMVICRSLAMKGYEVYNALGGIVSYKNSLTK